MISVTPRKFSPIHLIFILALIFFCNICVADSKINAVKSQATIGILWEISKENIAPSYVFGTVHSEDERVTELPIPVIKQFNESKTFVLEMLLDNKNTNEIFKKMYFSNGDTLQSVIGDDLYQQSVKAIKDKGFPIDVLKRMKPWAVFTILNMPEQKTGLFMDVLLFKQAQTQSKIIRALETQQEQTAVFDDMPMASQVSLLKSTLDDLDNIDSTLEELIAVYLERDLDKLMKISKKYEETIDKAIVKDFNQRLIINRNHRMVKRMLPMLRDGYCFVAVGALHLPGEDGILTLLTKQGYQVRAVY